MATARRGDGGEAAAGINALEGYLFWQAETDRARDRAREFADTLPWLTNAQREEVEGAYVRDHLGHAETALRATVRRCAELRAEYRAAYRALSRRLVAVFLFAAALVAGTAALLAARG